MNVSLGSGQGTATAGTDHNVPGSVTIPANALFADVDLTVVDDTEVEPVESAKVTITGAGTSYVLSSTTRSTAQVNITSDDPPPPEVRIIYVTSTNLSEHEGLTDEGRLTDSLRSSQRASNQTGDSHRTSPCNFQTCRAAHFPD